MLITHIRGLITLLLTTHEPPSRSWGVESGMLWARVSKVKPGAA